MMGGRTFRYLHLFACLAQLHVGTVQGFQAFRSIRSRSSTQHSARSRRCRTFMLSEDGDHLNCKEENGSSVADIDGLRRRQILLAMLGGATGSAFLKSSKVMAEELAPELVTATASSAIGNSFMLRNIMKPPKDDREYFTYVLDNGLRVLLCSDPTSNEAAAAMAVHVGACSDPASVPGLAHFTEHMLFLGTKQYPKEDSFSNFLSANGGSSNAYTDTENTVYYFDMEAEEDKKLAEGLSIFGAFFSSPLFTESATGRELNAIESENAKNLQTDSFRVFQLSKARANPDHPYSKFFTGNRKTLLEDTKKQNINLRKELIKFHNKYYSANQMTLALVAPQSLDTLQKMVQDSFSAIPNRQVDKPEKAWAGTLPFSTTSASIAPSLKHIAEVVPVRDLRQVSLSWPLVYLSDQDRNDALLVKQTNYVAHLLGHEGPGSLLSYLKSKGWATSVGSGSETELSDFETFDVTVGLTSQGLESVDSVIEAIFSYLGLLRSQKIPDYIFEEVLQLNELEWRYMTKGNVGGYVQSLAAAMQEYPPPLYVAGTRRLALSSSGDKLLSWDTPPRTAFSSKEELEQTRDLVNQAVAALTVDNCIFSVISKSFQGKTDRKEKWYGTDYSVKPIPKTTELQWINCANFKSLEMDFPKRNAFIPSEAGLKIKLPPKEQNNVVRSFEERMKPIPPPVVIRDDGRWTVHFKQDDRFGQPKAFVVFQLLTPSVFSSAKQAALSNLYEVCISDRLTEYAYDAGLAGLTYDVKVLPRGVRLTIGGYNDKLLQFTSYVSKKVSADVNDILPRDDVEFEKYRDQILRALAGFDVKQPYSHASYYGNINLQPLRFQYTNKQLREASNEATRQDLIGYATKVWSSGKGQALIQGNLDEREALYLVDTVDKVLGFETIPSSEVPAQLIPLPLPINKGDVLKSATTLEVEEPNKSDGNSAVHVMIQCLDPSEKAHVLLELINAIVSQPFYDDLRTKQQLGYIVASGVSGIGNTRTLNFVVQSSVAPADKLALEITKFLNAIRGELLEKLPKADLAVFVKGLLDRKLEPDKTLSTEVMRNWLEISRDRLEFDRVQKEAAALLDIKKTDVIKFWDNLFVEDNKRRVLITKVVPRNGAASSPLPPGSRGYKSSDSESVQYASGIKLGIDDIEAFRRDRDISA